MDSFFAAIDESARIHDDDIGIFFPGSNGVALPCQCSEHDFAVHQVLGTAEADKPDLRRCFI